MLVHNLSPENAAALRNLTNQIHCSRSIKPEESRKTKGYTPKSTVLLQDVLKLQ